MSMKTISIKTKALNSQVKYILSTIKDLLQLKLF